MKYWMERDFGRILFGFWRNRLQKHNKLDTRVGGMAAATKFENAEINENDENKTNMTKTTNVTASANTFLRM